LDAGYIPLCDNAAATRSIQNHRHGCEVAPWSLAPPLGVAVPSWSLAPPLGVAVPSWFLAPPLPLVQAAAVCVR